MNPIKNVKLRPTRWDALVAAAVVLLAAVSAAAYWRGTAAGARALTAVVSINGAEADRIFLSSLAGPETRSYTGRGYTLTVEFSPEGVRVTEADCPNLDCIHTGRVSAPGRSVVCLPARIVIQLSGDSGVDVVLG